MHVTRLLTAGALALALAGCGQQDTRTTDTSLPDGESPKTAANPPGATAPAEKDATGAAGTEDPHAGIPGMSPGAGGASMPAPPPLPPDPEVQALEAKLAKNPGDAGIKKELVAKLVQVGSKTMFDPDLPPRQKYRAALKMFNRALELDPNQPEAKKNRQQIVDIYKMMGRPVPET